jgi:hypothetical protein
MKGKLRITLGLAIVVATIAAFIWYVGDNPEVLRQLKQTPLYTIILMFLLFAGSMTAALMLVLYGSMSFYTKHITWQENFLLNSYSSLLNFFGPGQSGPAFRGAYLKMKHGLKIKQYIFMTLVYYAFYAFFSGMLLASTALPWWQTVSLLILITIVCCIILKLYLRRNMDLLGQNGFSHLKPALIIGGATLLQVLLLWVLYFVELRSFDNSVSLGQLPHIQAQLILLYLYP